MSKFQNKHKTALQSNRLSWKRGEDTFHQRKSLDHMISILKPAWLAQSNTANKMRKRQNQLQQADPLLSTPLTLIKGQLLLALSKKLDSTEMKFPKKPCKVPHLAQNCWHEASISCDGREEMGENFYCTIT